MINVFTLTHLKFALFVMPVRRDILLRSDGEFTVLLVRLWGGRTATIYRWGWVDIRMCLAASSMSTCTNVSIDQFYSINVKDVRRISELQKRGAGT